MLLTGTGEFSRDGDCASTGYAPHSQLFRHCAAIVHHGGIGTVGQALRAGRPQLVVPFFGDQYDNAARVQELGVGRKHDVARFSGASAAAVLASLLEDQALVQRAEEVGRQVAAENGAAEAARRIMNAMTGT